MRRGVESHVSGDYDSALEFRSQADRVATDLLEHGRARRDIAATYQRSGDYDSARTWIYRSLSSLEQAVENNLDNARESVGLLATGLPELYDTIFKEDLPEDDSPNIDQYRINMLGAASIASSLAGYKKHGTMLARRTIRAGFWSESPKLDTSADHLSAKERIRRKIKVAIKGAGALAVASLSEKRRQNALSIARKII